MPEYLLKTYGSYGAKGKLLKDKDTGRMVYETLRRRTVHFHRNLKAWGISENIYEDIVRLGCDKVRVVLMSERITLYADIADFVKHGQKYTFVEGDPQIFLREKFWREEKL